jgi:sialic acid synthase SpsE
MRNKTFIIAEAGVNHNGKSSLAFELIDIAKESGADAVKFQLFSSENLVTKYAVKAEYQIKDKESSTQLEMLKKLELSKKNYEDLKNYCKKKKIEFMCTAFDKVNLNFLIDKLNIKRLKIGSGEVTNGPLLMAHAKKNQNLILSTGMSNLIEVKQALSVIAYGYLNLDIKINNPSLEDFKKAYASSLGQDILKKKVTLLHCTTEYPAPIKDLNLKAIPTMRDHFGLKIGYSDHSKGVYASLAAVYLGAKVIEKHFTIDKTLNGPDHKASLEPNELKDLITKIRKLERANNNEKLKFINSINDFDQMLGNGIKKAMNSEIKNIKIARRYLVAKNDILIGEKFTENNLTCKRSKQGISPMLYWDFLGKHSKKNYLKDDII